MSRPAAEPSHGPQARIEGILERIVYSNEENAYTVGEFRLAKVKGADKERTTSIIGVLPGVQCGETLVLFGQWTRHPRHGEQFQVQNFESRLPGTVYGIRKYLGSGLVPGIGPKYADRIVEKFGADTMKVITEESGRLQEVEGIGKGRASSIKKAWDEQRAVRDVLMFLQTYGVTPNQCVRLVKKYGIQTRALLEENPFRIAREIERIGFKTADRIARNLGFSNESDERIDAGLLHAMAELEEEGHTLAPARNLVAAAVRLLEVAPERITARIQALADAEQLVAQRRDDHWYYQLPTTARAEERLVKALHRLLTAPPSLPDIHVEKAIEWAQERAGFHFAKGQEEALHRALTQKISILTGGPGTGKTTILRSLVAILKAKRTRLLLASPTGRAAQRLSESARMPAATIHRLLKFDPGRGGFFHDAEHPLPCEMLIVDETSMLDTRLAASLLRALHPRAHLLLVGDADQLPSVGAGNVLHDLLECGSIPVTRLDRIFRQGEASGIVSMAHAILGGDAHLAYTANLATELREDFDFHFILAESPEACLRKTCKLISDFLPVRFGLDPIQDVQVLAPMHRGKAGIQNLNTELQAWLNPPERAQERLGAQPTTSQRHFREKTHRPLPFEIPYGSQNYRIGDKVIQTRNNYDLNLFNGDIGTIISISADARELCIDFDGEVKELEKSNLGDLQQAYAISIHKSQGSEYPVVVVPLLKQHFMMLQRNLIYTAVTRARRQVFMIGDPGAWQMAVRNREAGHRQTDLIAKLEALR